MGNGVDQAFRGKVENQFLVSGFSFLVLKPRTRAKACHGLHGWNGFTRIRLINLIATRTKNEKLEKTRNQKLETRN
jgi:hypothetical protein